VRWRRIVINREQAINTQVITALHGMQTRSSDENSVCPSVRLSNACFVTKTKQVLPGLLHHKKERLS